MNPAAPGSLAARLRARLQAAQLAADAADETQPASAVVACVAHDRAVAGNLLACAIAFRLFLWLLPVTLLAVALLGFAEASEPGAGGRLADDLTFDGSIVATVSSAAQQAAQPRWLLLVLALVGLLGAGKAGARTLTMVHALVWGSWTGRQKLGLRESAAFTGIALAVLALATGAKVVRAEVGGIGLSASVVIGAVYAAVWLLVSARLPRGDQPWRRLVPGALVFGGGTQLVHIVTVAYLAGRIEKSSSLYGGLGVAATTLLGLYFVARVIVLAAVTNAVLARRDAASRGRSFGAGDG